MLPRLWLLLAAQLAALPHGCALRPGPGSLTVQTNGTATLSCETKAHPASARVYWLRLQQAPSVDSQHEFLAYWDPVKGAVHGPGKGRDDLAVSQDASRSTLRLRNVRPRDSGTYVCMTIGSPKLAFWTRTRLSVVDILPTPPQPTKKSTPKKRVCRPPSPAAPRGPPCSPLALGLLLAGALLLLLSLSVAVHLCCLRRRARLRFMKQFYS
ncbi:T-cell surface glycoprotein CD8 beta chain [Dasypus novemcinctus]|uniref:T-cell surface glycoprotein CD8 beta chain n=1 Tax=Dasypus novemcinctus TaxID=9361 RepID=UPI00265FBEEC|nr:T-cell surface glycoprotein CD8 beta chain [Dasypus novemcinctus]